MFDLLAGHVRAQLLPDGPSPHSMYAFVYHGIAAPMPCCFPYRLQCDRHAQNIFVDERGQIKLIDNEAALQVIEEMGCGGGG